MRPQRKSGSTTIAARRAKALATSATSGTIRCMERDPPLTDTQRAFALPVHGCLRLRNAVAKAPLEFVQRSDESECATSVHRQRRLCVMLTGASSQKPGAPGLVADGQHEQRFTVVERLLWADLPTLARPQRPGCAISPTVWFTALRRRPVSFRCPRSSECRGGVELGRPSRVALPTSGARAGARSSPRPNARSSWAGTQWRSPALLARFVGL